MLTHTFFLPPGDLAEGWWGNQRTRVAHELDGLYVAADPALAPQVAAALSDGRLAYATYAGRSEVIDVRDLATNVMRTVARFTGSASLLGIGLDGSDLGWAQRSFGFTTPTAELPCVTQTQPLGPVKLVNTMINLSAPISEPGAPIPPRTGPICPPPP